MSQQLQIQISNISKRAAAEITIQQTSLMDREHIIAAAIRECLTTLRSHTEAVEAENAQLRRDVDLWRTMSNEFEGALDKLEAAARELAPQVGFGYDWYANAFEAAMDLPEMLKKALTPQATKGDE